MPYLIYDGVPCFRVYNDFLEELEEDPEARKDINIYKGMCLGIWSIGSTNAVYYYYAYVCRQFKDRGGV